MLSSREEVLRCSGPVQNTKPAYAAADMTLHGVTIPKGATVMPLVGAANHDPAIFERPEIFDMGRTPNRHLRLETRIALTTLLERSPNLRLAVAPQELVLQPVPSWHRYTALPVVLS